MSIHLSDDQAAARGLNPPPDSFTHFAPVKKPKPKPAPKPGGASIEQEGKEETPTKPRAELMAYRLRWRPDDDDESEDDDECDIPERPTRGIDIHKVPSNDALEQEGEEGTDSKI